MVHFKKTTTMKFGLTFITLLLFQLSFGQNRKTEIKYGLYGIYADPSFYQELTINENGTFHFYDRVELGTSDKYQGKWKIEKNKITLFDFENNKRKPIPTTYIYKKDQLCSISNDELCFKFQSKDKTNKQHIESIRKVFEDYIKYQESTDSQDDKDLMTKSLKSIENISDKDDLDLLINIWMYYDPTDYPDIPEIYRILKDSRPHSIEAVKNRIDNKKEWETDDTAPYSDLKNLLKRLENE
jgi:hypothetical protein